MKKNQLIVFEGVDAAGKSTVCKHYLERLALIGISARLLSFPGKEPRTLGELVYQLHHSPQSKGVSKCTPASLQALHIAAHLDAIESVIVPSLEAGQTVILDRYWWSTWVYGVVGKVDRNVLSALIEAERIAWGPWQPGIVFHVTRSTPLRKEPLETWNNLSREYDVLAKNEAARYPVFELFNDRTLDETVSTALNISHDI